MQTDVVRGIGKNHRLAGVLRLPRNKFELLTLILAVSFIAIFFYPVINLVASVFIIDGTLQFSAAFDVLADGNLGRILGNTLIVVIVAVSLAMLIGTALAWLTERTDASLGWISRLFAIIPLMLPPIALGVGWYFLAEQRTGFLNSLLGSILGHTNTGPLNISTWPGLIWVYTLYLVPFVFLTMSAAFRNLDPALEEASKMSGASDLRTFWRISIPAVRPAIGSSILLAAIAGVSLFSVPTIIGTNAGIEVLSVHIVRVIRFSYPPRMFEGAVLSVLLVLIVTAAWVVQRRLAKGERFAQIGGKAGGTSIVRLGRIRWVARFFMVLFLAFSSVVPLAALIIVALQRYWSPSIDVSLLTLDNFRAFFGGAGGAINALGTSIQLGLMGATIGMGVAALLMVHVHSGTRSRTAQFTDIATKAPGAVSHIIIGVAFLIAYGGAPFRLYGTMLILLLAYVVMYMPQASTTAGDAILRVGRDLNEASRVSGASHGSTFRSITLPLIFPGLVAGWCILFVVMVGDLTASALLSSTRAPVVGFAILEIWENGVVSQLAALVVVICAVSTTVVGGMLFLTRDRRRRRRRSRIATDF